MNLFLQTKSYVKAYTMMSQRHSKSLKHGSILTKNISKT